MNTKQSPTLAATLTAFVVATVGAGIVNAVIAVVTLAAGASDDFNPLQPGAYLFLTVIGVLVATIVWRLVVGRAQDPAAVLRWLVPTAVVVSLIPDVMLLVDDSMEGSSTGAVLALMLMHVATAAVVVPVFQRFMPARALSRSAA
jgi:hypothetical protein